MFIADPLVSRIRTLLAPPMFAFEVRRDAADLTAFRTALHRLAGDLLPYVGRVVALQPLVRGDGRNSWDASLTPGAPAG
jgi:hypothetical protein